LEIACVTLGRIDVDDRTFDLSFGRRYEGLQVSIAAVGVLQPVIVRPPAGREGASGDRVAVVCGFGRVRVAVALGLGTIPVRILDEATSDGDCLRLALFDNLAHRRFNALERAIILEKLAPHVDRERLITQYLPRLGMQASAVLFDRTMALNRLIPALQTAAAEERIEPNVAARLCEVGAGDQEAVAALLARCRPSVSIAREWIDTLLDIARRDGCSVAAILAAPPVRSILESDEPSAAERTAALRRRLHGLRYPTLLDCETRFCEARERLRLPPSMRLEPASSFESDERRLEIRFCNEAQLRAAADRIARWFDDPSLPKRLWPERSGKE